MHGLDSFIAPPPLSAVVSLLLLAGVDYLGLIVLRLVGLARPGAPRWQRWQAVVTGAMTLAVIAYPLALANLTSLNVMRALAAAVGVLGLINGIISVRTVRRIDGVATRLRRSANGWHVLLAVLLAGATLMALGPVTDADSLDYHIGVPIFLLNAGGMPVTPEWFHSRIAGSNEVLNAIGLAAGAEAIGALLQLGGLFAITGLLLFAETPDAETARARRTHAMVAVATVSAPVLVALISQKPQLLPIAMTTLALALVTYPSRTRLTGASALANHTLVCFLVMSASQAKLTYLLGGSVVGMLSLVNMARRRVFWQALAISSLAGFIVFGPPMVWKHYFFHDSYLNSLIRPVPGDWPGTENFEHHLRYFRDSVVPFPLSLIIPSGKTTVSTVIGPAGFILLLALRPRRDYSQWTLIGAATFDLIGSMLLGPPTSRSYLEPYFWLLMVFALEPDHRASHLPWITWPIATQGLFTATMFWYGVLTLFPGALTAAWRERVMDRSANGYRAIKWSDSVLPADAVMITTQRSMALVPRAVVPLDWIYFVNPHSPAAVPYLERLKRARVTHMLVTGDPPQFEGLSACLGPLVAGPVEGHYAERNPFSTAPAYSVRIFAFDSQRLPQCAGAASGADDTP